MLARDAAPTYRVAGLLVREHEFSVPLDHARPDERIVVFAREIAEPDGMERPFLVFFQGGPGHESPRPLSPTEPVWLKRALRDYRVLMLDQRGTGRSTPVGTLPGLAAAQQAEYLSHFRADAIVRDAEYIRAALGIERWSVLGQSFGGFCVVTYLSFAPSALTEAFITGGLPPLDETIDDIYRDLYARVLERSRRYFARYPEDRERMRAIQDRLERNDVLLPTADTLTWPRFAQLGHVLGMSDGAERLHYLLELPLESPAFLYDVERALPFARNPLYAILHEACYADGSSTNWSAERVLPPGWEAPDRFTGEMIFPWMFSNYGALAPLREAAEMLAARTWGPLYDLARLRENDVPVAAIVYLDDMYVARTFSEQTAATIRGLRTWMTNEYEHNGLRADGERILDRLIALCRERM